MQLIITEYKFILVRMIIIFVAVVAVVVVVVIVCCRCNCRCRCLVVIVVAVIIIIIIISIVSYQEVCNRLPRIRTTRLDTGPWQVAAARCWYSTAVGHHTSPPADVQGPSWTDTSSSRWLTGVPVVRTSSDQWCPTPPSNGTRSETAEPFLRSTQRPQGNWWHCSHPRNILSRIPSVFLKKFSLGDNNHQNVSSTLKTIYNLIYQAHHNNEKHHKNSFINGN